MTEHDLWAQNNIRVLGIFDADPPFQYTVGLWKHNLPEIIVVGLPMELGGMFLNLIAAYMHEHGRFNVGDIDRNIFNCPTLFGSVSTENLTEYMQQALNAVGQTPPREALQAIWPDRVGLFPGEPGYAREFARQELLA